MKEGWRARTFKDLSVSEMFFIKSFLGWMVAMPALHLFDKLAMPLPQWVWIVGMVIGILLYGYIRWFAKKYKHADEEEEGDAPET